MRPNIVVSSLDMERLEALIDSLPAAQADNCANLLEELSRADMVEPQEIPPNVVTMNSRVRFVLDGQAEEFDMQLAYPKDVNGAADKLSVLTPVGNALLGLKVGDSIEWKRPDGGAFQVRVLDIVYQPERAGELHR
ncbi:nucleoside diphosphate kinase regulator [Massilia sp.]|uniref:nucleoside diphosphate kinase regulator n=1 Tax=Massilia sp. TaxID=1882437 RepID=UPI00289BB2F5|nr:nucleoside diphosphate kinase regulator [Massilia sp.]